MCLDLYVLLSDIFIFYCPQSVNPDKHQHEETGDEQSLWNVMSAHEHDVQGKDNCQQGKHILVSKQIDVFYKHYSCDEHQSERVPKFHSFTVSPEILHM
jgi:hypothetical protein